MGHLADAVAGFLRAQVAAGAQAVQLFDSWVGASHPTTTPSTSYPYSPRIFAAVAERGRAPHPLRDGHRPRPAR